METKEDVDLLLIGKTGNGKSSSGNSILMTSKGFDAKPSTQSVTRTIHFNYSLFNSRMIKVVDGPGVGDTRMSDEEALKLIEDRLRHAITANPQGYHAFVLVIRYGVRFTKEEEQTVHCLRQIFGPDFVRNFCIILVTHGDNFKIDEEDNGPQFDQWLQDQTGNFKDILDECSHRVVLFDNKTNDVKRKKDQLTQLLSFVDRLGGRRYTDKHFEKAAHLREKFMIESKEPHAREETLKETAFLSQSLEELRKQAPQDQIKGLRDLRLHSNQLAKTLHDQDKGTGALKYSIEAARSIEKRIESQMKHCKEVIRSEKEAEEEQKKLRNEHDARWKKQIEDFEKAAKQEKLKQEKERQDQISAAEKRLKEQKEDQCKRHERRLQDLRKELEHKGKEESRQREKELKEALKDEMEKAEEARDEELRQLEAKLNKKSMEDDESWKKKKNDMQKRLEKEQERREQEERDKAEKCRQERQDEMMKYENELNTERQKTEEAFARAREDTENFLVNIVGTLAAGAVKVFLISRLGPFAFMLDMV